MTFCCVLSRRAIHTLKLCIGLENGCRSGQQLKALPMTGHGIPQGPIASDFLAEAFFLPIDIELQKIGCKYTRYVDDIRLFGKSENEVRRTAVMLEQFCRHRGLIPQNAKFEITRLESPDDAMGALPSISPIDPKGTRGPEMSADQAKQLLRSAIGGKPLRIKDKARFRYVMYRAPIDSEFLNLTRMLLPRHPEHIDAFIAYFSNFVKRRSIANAAVQYLENELPYAYVRGELWHLVARIGDESHLKRALPLARIDAKRRKDCMVLSWGVMHFLIQCERYGLIRIGKRLSSESNLSRVLLAPILPKREFSRTGHVKALLKGTIEEQLAAVRQLQRRGVSLNSIGVRQRDLSPLCRNTLRSLGVIRRRQNLRMDYVASKLVSLYGCKDANIWHLLLGGEYEHALQILIEAETRFRGASSEWLALQDSFNDIIVRQFFVWLKSKNLQGHSKLYNGKRLVKYGNLIAVNSPFDKHFPVIADLLRRIHRRRNQLPGSHPYDEKGGAKNHWLTNMEKNALSVAVRDTLDLMTSMVKRHS